MSRCKPSLKSEQHGIWGPKDWSIDSVSSEPELFKGRLDFDRCSV